MSAVECQSDVGSVDCRSHLLARALRALGQCVACGGPRLARRRSILGTLQTTVSTDSIQHDPAHTFWRGSG